MMAKKERVRRIRAERSKTEIIMKPIKVTSGAPRGRSAQGGRRESYQSTQSQQSSEQQAQETKETKNINRGHENITLSLKKELKDAKLFFKCLKYL